MIKRVWLQPPYRSRVESSIAAITSNVAMPPGDAAATVMATSGHTDAGVSVNSGAPGFPVRWVGHPIRYLRGAVCETG